MLHMTRVTTVITISVPYPRFPFLTIFISGFLFIAITGVIIGHRIVGGFIPAMVTRMGRDMFSDGGTALITAIKNRITITNPNRRAINQHHPIQGSVNLSYKNQ